MALGLKKKTAVKPAANKQAPSPARKTPSAAVAPIEGLNPRQAAFVAHYVANGGNATQAAIKAGYSKQTADQQGHALLKHPRVSVEITERLAGAQKELDVTAERVLAEVAKLAFSNMADYLRAGHDGAPVLDFSNLTRDQAAALESVTVEEFTDGRSDKREVRRTRFKLADKTKSLEMLMKRFRLLGSESEANPINVQINLLGLLLQEIDAESRGDKLLTGT
jgi:phage terminase small subunit